MAPMRCAVRAALAAALAAAPAAASADGPPSSAALAAAGACRVGVALGGLGALDGDYMFDGPKLVKFGAGSETLLVQYRSAAKNPYLSPADADRTAGRWALIEGGGGCGPGWRMPPCRLLAVCEAGCPDMPASSTSAAAGQWPAAGAFRMQWATSDGGEVAKGVTASCCRRKPQLCDWCGEGTCSSWFWANKCPGMWNVQKECCEQQEIPIFPWQKCDCKRPRTVCDHPRAGVVESVANGTVENTATLLP